MFGSLFQIDMHFTLISENKKFHFLLTFDKFHMKVQIEQKISPKKKA